MDKEVTILGAGIVGICTALSLAERGVPVHLIDRGDPGQETSFGNAGVIAPGCVVPQAMPGLFKSLPKLMFGKKRAVSVHPSYWTQMIGWGAKTLRLATETRARETSAAMDLLCAPSISLYRRHLDGTGSEHLVRDSSYLFAFRDASKVSLTSLDAQLRIDKGTEAEILDGPALRRLEPALSPEFRAAFVMHGQARALAPGEIATVLAGKARRLGVRITRDTIQRLEPIENGWRVVCTTESHIAARVVLTLGAWSPALLEPLGIHVPLVTERGYHVEFPTPAVELSNSVMDGDAKFVVSSMTGGLRAAGQAEFGPNDAPRDPKHEARMIAQVRAMLPDLDPQANRFWMGRRPSFPDSLPMIGEFPRHKGLFAGFGHSHFGLMMAPKTGELLADLLAGGAPNVDLSAFGTGRF